MQERFIKMDIKIRPMKIEDYDQLYELWKKLKHKLADRQFLLSLLPALLIALYLAGLLIHAAYNGVRIMFSANTSAEPIWNWNPFVAISSVFSPFGIFLATLSNVFKFTSGLI